jgi:hypothetical protein
MRKLAAERVAGDGDKAKRAAWHILGEQNYYLQGRRAAVTGAGVVKSQGLPENVRAPSDHYSRHGVQEKISRHRHLSELTFTMVNESITYGLW